MSTRTFVRQIQPEQMTEHFAKSNVPRVPVGIEIAAVSEIAHRALLTQLQLWYRLMVWNLQTL